jgi:arylsulfatase A-like enzyme
VIVVGDHGESLGEHGEQTHGLFVYESVTRVPLIIRAPAARMRGRRVADVVRSVDVMPTVLDLLGIPVPASVAGASLAARTTGAAGEAKLETYSETMYPRYHFGWSELRAPTGALRPHERPSRGTQPLSVPAHASRDPRWQTTCPRTGCRSTRHECADD